MMFPMWFSAAHTNTHTHIHTSQEQKSSQQILKKVDFSLLARMEQ